MQIAAMPPLQHKLREFAKEQPLRAQDVAQQYRRRMISLQLENLWRDEPGGYAADPDLSFEEVTGTLGEHVDLLDTDQSGAIDVYDLAALAEDPNAPRELREAARALLANPNYLNALDVAGGDAEADLTFTERDIQAAHEAEQRAPDDLMRPEEAAGVLDDDDNFAALDADGNGEITREDLLDAIREGKLNEEQTEAALALLLNDNTFNALDVSFKHEDPEADGGITRDEAHDVTHSPNTGDDNVWDSTSDQALQRALEHEGEWDNLFTAFDQGSMGNCVSVAVIKAGMDQYGNDVFENVEPLPGGGYRVTMRDGYVVELTEEEMEAAAMASDFKGDDPEAVAYATLCFAAAAKRAQLEGHNGADTFAEGLWALTTGDHIPEVAGLLGLEVEEIPRSEVDERSGGVMGSGNGHAVYMDTVAGETYIDLWTRDRNGNIRLEDSEENGYEGPETFYVFA